MSIFVQASRIIGSLAGLGQQAAGVGLGVTGGSEFSTEYIAGAATSGAADFGSLAVVGVQKGLANYARNMSQAQRMLLANRMGGQAGMKAFKQGLSIISITLTIVELMELTTGFGPPSEGNELNNGSQQFAELSEQLKSALPDYRWEGAGSEAYAQLGETLEAMAQSMATLDSQLATLVKDQAEWVTHARFVFGILKDVLLAAIIVELILMFAVPAPAGPIAAKAFAIAVATLGLGVAATLLGSLTYFSVEIGKKAEGVASQYSALAAGTVQTGSTAQATVVTSEATTVSSFEAVSNSMSGPPTLSAGPAPASSAAAGSRSDDERDPLNAESSATSSSSSGSADSTDAPGTAPAVTMPALTQVAAMSGQGVRISSQVSQPTALVNQAVGQLQQMLQTAQQGRGAEEAEDGAPAGELAGAGTGLAGVERAPIGVAAAGTERAQAPNPSERSL